MTWTIKQVLAAVVLVVAATVAEANFVYSWSGFVEPLGGTNPWGLSGDGSALTATDGTPYTIRIFLDQDALDVDSVNFKRAAFFPAAVDLMIGDNSATFVRGLDFSGSALSFSDDLFGTLDRIGFLAQVSLFGTTLTFGTDIRIPITSFRLADFGVDPPPTFAPTMPIQFGGANTGNLLTLPANAPVTVVVPEPSSLALVSVAVVGMLATAVRRRISRGRHRSEPDIG